MEDPERDNLLIRVDERTNNIWRVLESLEEHQRAQNDGIKEALLASAKNAGKIKIILAILIPLVPTLATKIGGLW